MSSRSSKFGTINYSVDEMRRLNVKVRAVLPLAGEDWLCVAYQFNHQRPEAVPYREVESLKRKFKKMYCIRGKSLPDYVMEAKELRRLISQRLDKATAKETETEAEQGARDLTLKLRQMEDEYHRTLEEKGTEAAEAVALQEQEFQVATSTSGAIAMLRKRVERKRCLVEEQVLNENTRVRRERKRRKMEQVLQSIQQEHCGREVAKNGSAAVTEADTEVLETGNLPLDCRQSRQKVLSALSSDTSAVPPLSASPHPTNQPSSTQDTSLCMMELLLQFMTAQQRENAQRLEVERARREQERREREARRQQQELQRQREHRELMLAMGALMGDRFPDSLKHYLNREEQQQKSGTPTPQNTNLENSASRNRSTEQRSSLSTSPMTTDPRRTKMSDSVEESCVKTRVEHQTGVLVDKFNDAVTRCEGTDKV
ncbi:hypothetical protein F441_08620 [Phytophthora nicotianae CJ01A1]|uniref:DUF6818 domain-containing protein n=1 Tax=Phytophthora nicotianae CJ01A1 TaxID=1317063 RepID=W2X224_PHYNI|nr:hypothetical protein F441_08620 [Phytophthora nicotianae CJ01A1]